MPRAPVTSDIFNAVAEPRRRQIIDRLADGQPLPVNDLVNELKLPQPAVSKHLGILREVSLVSVTRRGRQRLYQLNPEELRPVHEWTKTFERLWPHQLDRIKQRAEHRARQRAATKPSREKP